MRDQLWQVVRVLENEAPADRVREAALLQDELREAMNLVAAIRGGAAWAAIRDLGAVEAAAIADVTVGNLEALAAPWARSMGAVTS